MSVEATLADRGTAYGEYTDGAKIAMDLFGVVQATPSYGSMSEDKQYAMFMFCAKMARILNGQSDHADSWHDIAGYATLAHDRCVEVAA